MLLYWAQAVVQAQGSIWMQSWCIMLDEGLFVAAGVKADLQASQHLMCDSAPHSDDVAKSNSSKELSTIAEATQGAFLQGEVCNLFWVRPAPQTALPCFLTMYSFSFVSTLAIHEVRFQLLHVTLYLNRRCGRRRSCLAEGTAARVHW